ncbi:immunoglobulin lambda-1 light chain-like isoform X2 [Tachysurus fulvidraco]|uniref:immunoglobulin lambda-1 light chain-like isoform X2 n=1 Tax=Tachysurus fulvidraco TaxID=1234273 RepID=UPI001FF06D2E|nr:immunoglobulin lambda-1 light chain-like isoform X2 [Tachysurus fulvidraco]
MFEIRVSGRFSMAARLLLLCCVSTLRTSLSSVVHQSPDFISVSVGDSFKLKCSRDLPIAYCYTSFSWYKVNPRSGKLDDISKDNKDQAEDDKLSCTRTIFNARVQDSGTYYCASIHDKMLFIGTGTRVVVTDTGPVKPTVVLYAPVHVEVEEEMELEVEEDAPSVLLQCVVMDVVPSQVKVSWLVDEDERTGWTDSDWTGHDNAASENTRAQIRVSVKEWMDATIQCVVKYKNQTVYQTMPPRNHSDSCTWLLYGGCGVAVFTIAVAITVALCLRKEKRTFPIKRRGVGVDVQRKHRAEGKQETLRNHLQKSPMEVEYSSLNHEIFKRPPAAPPPLEIN